MVKIAAKESVDLENALRGEVMQDKTSMAINNLKRYNTRSFS